MSRTIQRKTFTDGLRAYLVYLLNYYQQRNMELTELSTLHSFCPAAEKLWKQVLNNSKRVLACIFNCQCDDERGVHPYYVVSGLTVIDKAIDCLDSSVEAAQQLGRPFFASYEANAEFCACIVKLSLSMLVTERTGDPELAAVYSRAIGRKAPHSIAHTKTFSAVNYDSKAVAKIHTRANERMVKARTAEAEGRVDLARLHLRAAHLERIQLAHKLLEEPNCSCKRDKTSYYYAQALVCTNHATDYFAESHLVVRDVCPAHSELILHVARAMEEAAEQWIDLAHARCGSLAAAGDVKRREKELEDRMQTIKRRYMWGGNVPQLQVDEEGQRSAAAKAMCSAATCKYPPMTDVWLKVAAACEEGAKLTSEHVAAITDLNNTDGEIYTAEREAREQRQFANLLDKEARVLSAEVERLLCLQKEASRRAENGTELERVRNECWQAATHHLELAVQAGLAMLNEVQKSPRPVPSLTATDQPFLQHCTVSGYYVHIAIGVLSTAAQYRQRTNATLELGVNPHWQTASDWLVQSAQKRLEALNQLVSDGVDSLTSSMMGGEMTLRCAVADEREKAAGYWVQAAEQWQNNRRVERQLGGHAQVALRADALAALELAAETFTSPEVQFNAGSDKVMELLTHHELAVELIELLEDTRKPVSAEVIAIRTDCVRWAKAKAAAVRADAPVTTFIHYLAALKRGKQALTLLSSNPQMAAVYHHAAYYEVCWCEAAQQGLSWLASAYEKVVQQLTAATALSSTAASSILLGLHCAVADGLAGKVAPLCNGVFSASGSAPTCKLPTAGEDVQMHADDIVQVLLTAFQADWQAEATPDKDVVVHVRWLSVKMTAFRLVDALMAEVIELATRKPDPVAPSTHAPMIAALRELLAQWTRLAEEDHAMRVRDHLHASARLLEWYTSVGLSCVFERSQARRHRVAAWAHEHAQAALIEAAESALVVAEYQWRSSGGTEKLIPPSEFQDKREGCLRHNLLVWQVRGADLQTHACLAQIWGHCDAAALLVQAREHVCTAIELTNHLLTAEKNKRKGLNLKLTECEVAVAQAEQQAAAIWDVREEYY